MCGIAGVSFNPRRDINTLASALALMNESMAHRGPDDEGNALILSKESVPQCLLGNRRLAILDLSSAGHQPMWDEPTGNCIVLNGEIYNHLEIRRELPVPLNGWKSTSDTETILQAYAHWGIRCVNQLRGMFAFAIWDAAMGVLWCARDRLGIKPLYFFENQGLVLLASEVRALLSSGLVPRQIDPRGLAGFIRFGSVPEPYTLIRNVLSLRAGCVLRLHQGVIQEISSYWRPIAPENGVGTVPTQEACTHLRQELERAVTEHLLSDVPIASFLSGGLDSSIITALAAQHLNAPLRTFTVGFHEREYDESVAARKVAERFGTLHTRVMLSEDELIPNISAGVRSMDLPSTDGLNTFVISRAVAQDGIRVVLSGLGGDELFGGYRSFSLLSRVEQYSWFLRCVPEPFIRILLGRRAAQMLRSGLTLQDRYEVLRAFWSEDELTDLGMEEIPFSMDDPGPQFPMQTRLSVLELGGYMQSTLLRDGDAMSMANSLEMRIPFLDHTFVELCLRHGVAGFGFKHLLSRLGADLLPTEMRGKRKHGFVLPIDRWMRGALHGFVGDGLAYLADSRMLGRDVIVRLRRAFESGSLPWARLWQLVVLGYWLQDHICDVDETFLTTTEHFRDSAISS
jgi:asparagine synthase (glutamine-hydrolysing)